MSYYAVNTSRTTKHYLIEQLLPVEKSLLTKYCNKPMPEAVDTVAT